MLTKDISNALRRLVIVERFTSSLDYVQRELATLNPLAQQGESDMLWLRARLDEAGDCSKRDNLLFFGFADNASKTTQQTQETFLSLFHQSLHLTLCGDNIARAHIMTVSLLTKIV